MNKLLITSLLVAGIPTWSAGRTYNVVDYGARNDGSGPSTDAFRSAIEAARAAGGGTVFVPAGIPTWSAGRTYNVVDYGARNDGSGPSTDAFRSAIEAARAAGGGTVFVPAG